MKEETEAEEAKLKKEQETSVKKLKEKIEAETIDEEKKLRLVKSEQMFNPLPSSLLCSHFVDKLIELSCNVQSSGN